MARKDRSRILERALREFRWSFIITALVFIILGALLVLRPQLGIDMLSYTVGGALAIYGGFNILSFLFSRERSLSFVLVIGVITAAIGIFALVSPTTIFDIIQIVLGLVICIDSLLGMKRASALRDLGLKSWWPILLLSVVTTILGVLFMVNKGLFGNTLMVAIGIVLLYQGVSDLVTVIRISVIGHRLKEDLSLLVRDQNIIDADN